MKSRFTATEMSEVRANATSPRFAHGIFIILITILVYLQTVRFPFLNLDDTTFIVGHQYALQWSSVPAYFTGLTSDELKISYFYRPLVSCWSLLNYKFFGLHAGLWHLAAVI